MHWNFQSIASFTILVVFYVFCGQGSKQIDGIMVLILYIRLQKKREAERKAEEKRKELEKQRRDEEMKRLEAQRKEELRRFEEMKKAEELERQKQEEKRRKQKEEEEQKRAKEEEERAKREALEKLRREKVRFSLLRKRGITCLWWKDLGCNKVCILRSNYYNTQDFSNPPSTDSLIIT